jgi:prevent-host-death family protein
MNMAKNEQTIQTMTATDVRQHFASAINQVARHETEIIVEKSGVPVAAIVSIEDYRRLKDQDTRRAERFKIMDEVRAAFAEVPPEELEREAKKALDEVRAEMRAEREQGGIIRKS